MIEIRKLIHDRLKSIHPNVYFVKAPSNAPTPYLVYTAEIYDDGEGFQTITLDIDGWDIGYDSIPLETLMTNVNITFNKKSMVAENLSVAFYLDRIIPMVEEEKKLLRRLYMYQGRLYMKE